MNIAIVSKLWEETSPFSRGGTGASMGNLVNGLVERGHKITLFATGNSKTKAQKLISVKQLPYRGDYSEIKEYENIAEAFRQHKKFDIIHCAVEHKSVIFGELVKTPSLHSIRYGEFFKHELDLFKKYKKLNFVANSKAVKNYLPFLNWKGIVYNGLDVKRFSFNEQPQDYLLFLARLSPQKGPDVAIQVAKKVNKKLILAGKIVETDKKFLETKVLPYIDGEQIIYQGEVKFNQKVQLLKNAQVLLNPINCFEACSNTILEAMACGTPTIAFDKGSNKELIDDKKTGFVVKNMNQMVSAVKKINTIDRKNCRLKVEKHFSLEQMIDGYEKIYKKIIKQK